MLERRMYPPGYLLAIFSALAVLTFNIIDVMKIICPHVFLRQAIKRMKSYKANGGNINGLLMRISEDYK